MLKRASIGRSVRGSIMDDAVAVEVTGAAVLAIVFPGRLRKHAGAGYLESPAGDVCAGQKIDQMRIFRRSMWIMAIDAGRLVADHVLAVRE